MKRKTDNFNKFFNKKNNAAIKEEFRQEKKAAKKERKEAIERHFEEKRRARFQPQEPDANERPGFKGRPGGKHAGPGKPTVTGKGGTVSPAGNGNGPAAGKTAAHDDANLIPLNKYIAHGGICSRRDAAELIRQGKVEVNGQIITEPGTKVSPDDLVKSGGKKVTISRNFVYILLNKPKDYITTTEDPQGRKTVLDLIRQATTERVFPVGRLDRNTSGVLLLTNDGDLAQKLAHPRHEIKKIYHVSLDKPLTKGDFDQIIAGSVVLEDGPAIVDVIAYADSRDKSQVGLEIHSGRNRIVRRIFEHLGYDVRGLDRVTYAGLTKKNVQRGKWRLLTEKEVRILKYLNASFKGSPAKGAKATLRDQEAEAAKQKSQTHLKADIEDTTDEDEGWQDPADIDWEAAAAADSAKPFKKLPGKKKPPTLTLKTSKDDITAEDLAFAERKGYGGRKPVSNDGAKPPYRAKPGGRGGKPAFRGKPAPGGKSFSEDKPAARGGKPFGGKPSFDRSKKSFDSDASSDRGKKSFDGEKSFDQGKKSFGAGKSFGGGKSFDRSKKSFDADKTSDRSKKPFDADKSADRGRKSFGGSKSFDRSKKSFDADRSSDPGKKSFDRDKSSDRGKKSFGSDRSFDRDKSPGSDRAPYSGGKRGPATKRGPASGGARKSSRPPGGAPSRSSASASSRTARPSGGSSRPSGGSSRPHGKTGRPAGKSSRPSKGRQSR